MFCIVRAHSRVHYVTVLIVCFSSCSFMHFSGARPTIVSVASNVSVIERCSVVHVASCSSKSLQQHW